MNLAVVEDDLQYRTQLVEFLKRYCDQAAISVHIVTFNNGRQFMEKALENLFDLAFLDIYLEGDLNGMEIARILREQNIECKIVFSTVSEEFAVESYQVQAFDYLLKPYVYSRLEQTMRRYEKETERQSHYIQLKTGRIYRKVLLSDIIYTDYSNHYIQIHTDREILRSYMSFPEFSKMLEGYPQFLNCYRNCIVNMDYVQTFDEGDFVMKNQERIPVYRKLRTEMKQIYADYVFHKMSRGE